MNKVTDPVMLAELTRQGVDKSRVTLAQDYGKSIRGVSSPYAQIYADALSRKKFLVVSGLPMVDAYGQGHELIWRDKEGVIENGNNIFHSIIEGLDTRLVLLSPQPGGFVTGEELSYHPQLFIGGAEVQPSQKTPTLINDPLNENYQYNTLEWDYEICKRRIRLIEGRLLGSWVFTVPPGADVEIKYNQVGKFRLRLQYAKDEDSEFIPKEYFEAQKEWPVIISDSATFYPDAHVETSSVDGRAYDINNNLVWASIIAEPGSGAIDAGTSSYLMGMVASTTSNQWAQLIRGIYLFDTSPLPDTATISAATLSIRGSGKTDVLGCAPNTNVYSSAPASNIALEAGDFDSIGSTAFCDTPIAYASFVTNNYNNFTLNAAGIAAISKTGVSKFGTRNANYDVASVAPNWVSGGSSIVDGFCAEQGAGYQPKLVVTYTTGGQTYDETGKVQTILVVGSKTDNVISNELAKLIPIVVSQGKLDSAIFSDTGKLATILAVQGKTDNAIFTDIHEQTILAVFYGNAYNLFTETEKLQIILTEQGQSDAAIFNELAHTIPIVVVGGHSDLARFLETREQVILVKQDSYIGFLKLGRLQTIITVVGSGGSITFIFEAS